jgi:hypothetical protein
MHDRKPLLPPMARAWLAAAPIALAACLGPDGAPDPALPDRAFVFAVTSSQDYKTGAYAAYGLESGKALPDLAANHPDAMVRYRGGSDIFVINRTGRDNMLVVDRTNLKVVLAIKFPALSNPSDIEARNGRLYVGFLARDSILVYRQANGEADGAIDIHAYADDDGFAEAGALAFAGDYLYAIVQNLDVRNGYLPHADPKLLRIDVARREVIDALTLPKANPMGIAYDAAAGKLYIPCTGAYFDAAYRPALDGGLVEVDLAAWGASVLATEADLGGNLGGAILAGGDVVLPVSGDSDRIVAYSPGDRSARAIAVLEPYSLAGLAADGESRTLCVGDRNRGLRLFDLGTWKEKDTTDIDLGLAPMDLAVIR